MVQDLEKEYRGYDLDKIKKQKRKKQIVTYISGLAFAGSTLFGLYKMISKSINPPTPTPTETAQVSPANRLNAMEKGYLKVLSREPNNVTALEGLVQIKLEQGDQKGAIGYLEKLVQLYPDNPSYKAVLGEVQKANQPKK
jgi:tetratricopeptide (TPR) repeat protein